MKRLSHALLLLVCLCPLAQASTISTLLLHPGDTIYARFEVTPSKIKLISVSKEPDAQAQAIFSLQKNTQKRMLDLKVENKFPYDLVYRAEMRSLTAKLHYPAQVSPVVAGKVAFDTMPLVVEELAAYDFKLEK